MRFLFEIFPVFLFFMVFKYYDIYAATLVALIATFVQVLSHRAYTGSWSKQQVITLVVFFIFGSMTLYFHDPLFIKWKPTVVFWIFAILIFGTHFFAKKPLMQRFMEGMLQDKAHVPSVAWRRLNIFWGVFFLCIGGINLYVAYHYSNETWVNFKFYGITSLLILVSIFQALYLSRYMVDTKDTLL